MAIIDNPRNFFNTKLYTGNSGTQAITGVGFAPNIVWLKRRDAYAGWKQFDTVRGVNKPMATNSANSQGSDTNMLTAFGSDGFTLGSSTDVNNNTSPNVSWNWIEKAGVCDIVSFTGNGSARTISHSLGSIPTFFVVKSISNSTSWACYHQSQGATKIAGLFNDQSAPESNANFFNNTEPTSSVFSVGSDNTLNGNGRTFIAYLFGDTSMSKMGSYIGNGNADGTFVPLNFSPAMILVKCTSASNENWMMVDNKRIGFNTKNEQLFPNTPDDEETNTEVNFLSNGFKLLRDNSRMNGTNATYMYLAFAENSFVTSTTNGSIPTPAR